MENLLIICEKPSAARAFAAALGGETGTFEGDDYVITHLYGHILSLGTPAEVATKENKERVGNFSHLAGIPWSPMYFNFYNKHVISSVASKTNTKAFDGYEKAYKTVKYYLDNGYIPVIASDIDVSGEGDLLVQEVLDDLHYEGKRYREYHVSESPKNIIDALRNKKEVTRYDPVYMAGFTRASCDFLTQQYTRVATMAIQNQGYRLPAVVPFGRVKSVAIVTLGDQLNAIKNYKPSSVWESRYKCDNLILSAKGLPQFETKEKWSAEGLPLEARVTKVKEVPGTTKPPKPLNLTKLTSIMSKLGMRMKRTLELTQQLYEFRNEDGQSYLSYPRAAEDFVTTEQFKEMLPHVDQLTQLLELPTAAFTHRTPRPTHVKDEGAHGALRPGLAIPSSLDELDAKFGKGASLLYRTVTERFLLMFLEDTEWVRYEYETVGTTPVFKGNIKMITKQGVVDPDSEKEDDIASALPDITKPATLYPHEVKSVKPAKPTTSWLLKQLLKHDVGTADTQTQIVSTMVGATPSHPIKEGKELTLSVMGEIGYQAAQGTLIGSVEGTRFMQDCITAVKNGKCTPSEAMEKFSQAIRKDMQILKDKTYQLDGLGLEKTNRVEASGIWNGQEVHFNRQYSSHLFTDHEVEQLLAGQTITIEIETKKGKFKVKGALANMEYEGHPYVGFKGEFVQEDRVTGEWNGQTVTFKNSFAGHLFTPSEIQQLLAGETITIQTEKGTFKGALAKLPHPTKPNISYIGFKAEFPEREGYVKGVFNGKEITFKGSFMGHTYTPEEIETLLSGKKIVFKGTTQKGKVMMVAGGLKQQTYQGKKFWGLKPEFNKK